MSSKNSVKAIPLGYQNSAGFNAVTFTALVNGTLPESCFILRLISNSNTDYEISYDGVNAHDFLLSGRDLQINLSRVSDYGVNFEKGMTIGFRGTGGVGYVYMAGYYLDV